MTTFVRGALATTLVAASRFIPSHSTRAIADAKVKTDKVDALVLAQLLRSDFLPRVWKPDSKTQDLRRITNRRASLVAQRTGVKNRIHAVLHQRLIHAPVEQLFTKKGLAWLQQLGLDELGRSMLESELRLLESLDKEIERVSDDLSVRGYHDPRVKLLVTLPGVDVAVAQTLLAALGDVSRFTDGNHAASYLGLTPSIRQSADKCYHGPITKAGRGKARWMLVQAAQHLATHPGPLGVFFRRLAKRKNRNNAVVATARKLVVIAFHMLKNGEPYRYALPKRTEMKLQRMRTAAGKKRQAQTKGRPRPASYGTGVKTRTIPGLASLYAAEELPAVQPLRSGERKMLEDTGTAEHFEHVMTAKKISRPRRLTPS